MTPRSAQPGLLHERFRAVALDESDAPAGLALSTEAQWNQTVDDWRLLLRRGKGFGFEDPAGRLVASAVLLPYEGFAWISMVLVTADARRQSLATALLQSAMAQATAQGLTPMLDATEAGQRVYAPLGFRALGGITRWHAPRLALNPARSQVDESIGPLAGGELSSLANWDGARFGAAREELLRYLRISLPGLAYRAHTGSGRTAGFVVARTGRTATHVGPLVADRPATAMALLRTTLAGVTGPVLLDAVDDQTELNVLLRQTGFIPQRRFQRMRHGEPRPIGRPETQFAIAGPEFG